MCMKEVLIVEEKKEAREKLVRLVKEVRPDAVVYATPREGEAYAVALRRTIDLFIVDLVLHSDRPGGDHSGADFVHSIRFIEKYSFCPVIVVSSLKDYKMRMFSSLHCYQFIEKPYDSDKLKAVIKSAIRYKTKDNKKRYVYFHSEGVIEAVMLRDIVYIENRNRKMMVHTVDDSFEIPYKTCNSIIHELDSDNFIMCNRGTIINVEYIKSIDKVNRYVTLKDKSETLEIGPVIKKQFLEELRKRGKIL